MNAGADTGNNHRILDAVNRRKPTKKTKQPNKKKPIKVVYISNPMKVQTSASKFMALVQELTGRDADFPDPSKFSPSAVCGGAASSDLLHNTASGGGDDEHGASNLIMNNNNCSLAVELPVDDDILGSFYDDFDDLIFPPPVIGNFSGLLPAAAAVVYESYAR
ncbi:sigma factor binding protein 2, chloroplastic-like [Benincasa hispida]|uniref:sigma factor binding protein 2, chloroplastic-like n=1 Tax=Benincasa hispida TaxID=102211 RepID=UPI001900CBD7|nr:sigma factor binding protein 2, chloroplastic-like [Benincasa hispida]